MPCLQLRICAATGVRTHAEQGLLRQGNIGIVSLLAHCSREPTCVPQKPPAFHRCEDLHAAPLGSYPVAAILGRCLPQSPKCLNCGSPWVRLTRYGVILRLAYFEVGYRCPKLASTKRGSCRRKTSLPQESLTTAGRVQHSGEQLTYGSRHLHTDLSAYMQTTNDLSRGMKLLPQR